MPNPSDGRDPEPRPASHAGPPPLARPTRRSRIGLAAVAVVALVALLAGMIGAGFGGPGPPRGSVPASAVTGGTVTPDTGQARASGAPAVSTSLGPDATATPGSSLSPSQAPSDAPSGPPSGDPAVLADRLQAMLDQLRKRYAIPGVSVAILWDNGRSWLGASGLADVVGKTPITPDSGFALASISKTFTAAVVLQLVEEGWLTLDDPVAPRLPAYRLDRRITVRMLLDHTSGLPDFFLDSRIDKALQGAPGAAWTPARAWAYVAKKRPVPGSTWLYSNTNYLLLGELVKAVTGRPLAAEIRRRLLDPLALTSTWYQGVEKPRANVTVGYRLVAKSNGGVRPVRVAPSSVLMPFRSVVTAAGGAGSIAATALDAARWMQAFAGGRVLSPAMQQTMLADAEVTALLKARIPYGLGIQLTMLAGRPAVGHSGRYLGFQVVARYLPGEGLTIAVLTNQNRTDPAKLASALLQIVLPPLPPPTPTPQPPRRPCTVQGTAGMIPC